MQTFRTAMVGLGRSDVVAIRQAFESIFRQDQYQFDWVTADEPQLDILLVNSFFTTSTSIKRIMQQAHVATLVVDHEPSTVSVIEDNLHLPIKDTESIVEWFYHGVLHQESPVKAPAKVAPTLATAPVTAASTASMDSRAVTAKPVEPPENKAVKEPVSKLPPAASRPASAGEQGRYRVRETIDAVLAKKTGVWALKDNSGRTLAVADIPLQIAWIAPDYTQSKTKASLPLQLSSDYQAPAGFVARDLKQWLWQLAWDLETDQALLDKRTVCVLKSWPQPSASNQATLLKACAYLKNKPASAEQLGYELRLPLTDIQRLFTACFAVGFADEFNRDIHHHVVAQSAGLASAQQDVPAEQASFLRGFLSKFRQKLGI